jgi:putative DNA primase/helicase
MLGPKRAALSLSGIERSRFGLGNVKGKTLLTATEQPGGYVQASDTINTMISGEPLEIEEKWKAPYEIHPRAKFLWAMNELPRVHGANNGLFRRVKLLRMEAIPEGERDPEIKERIKEEGAGILNWALDGLERLRERGHFEVPQVVRDNTRRGQLDSDPPSLFFMERCEVGEEYSVGGGDLYLDYQTWCVHNGYKPKARNKVSEDWRRLGLRDEHTRRGTVWHGARLQGPLVRIWGESE